VEPLRYCVGAILVLYPSTNGIQDFLGLEVRDVCLRWEWISKPRTDIVVVEVCSTLQERVFNLVNAGVVGLVAIGVGVGCATSVEDGKTVFVV
jgi:hypothetical protein